MLLFLLPLLFNPFGLLVSYLPAFYLAIWPMIIQTLGRETLITHALVLILFIMTCDITRQATIKLIGFDLISLPAGIALLIALMTDQGTMFLSLVKPIFNGLLLIVEPVSLLIETYLFTEIIRSFNRWISEKANVRDTEAHDLSTWEPPLSRGAVLARIMVIVITIASYIGVFLVIEESKALLGSNESEIPINFHQAIATLVTLQMIAFSATIYKEEGILSESAMIALLASVPIFIASWSYSHLQSTNAKTSSWSSYFPFSILAGANNDNEHDAAAATQAAFRGLPDDPFDLSGGGHHQAPIGGGLYARNHYDLGGQLAGLDETLRRMELLDAPRRQLLVGLARRLIMIINSILGLSLDKLAKYYFGADFWAILVGRLLCLAWWASTRSGHQADGAAVAAAAGDAPRQRSREPNWRQWLPLSRRALVKLLLVLAYTQMLIQQMDNQEQLKQLVELPHQPEGSLSQTGSCCGQSTGGGELAAASAAGEQDLVAWFQCVWSNARACSSRSGHRDQAASRAGRLLAWLGELASGAWTWSLQALNWLLERLLSLHLLALAVWSVWLARWRSIIVQRLLQSILCQLYYIGSLLMASNGIDSEDL